MNVAVLGNDIGTILFAASGDALDLNALLAPFIEWLRSFGAWGVPVIIALAVWWQWSTVKDLPGVAILVAGARHGFAFITRPKLPTPRGDRFSVCIAHLVGDVDRRAETLIVGELRDLPGVEILSVDREVPNDGARGHEAARRILRETGADALIWGRNLEFGGQQVPKLYWTLKDGRADWKASDHYRPTAELKLPDLFWSDLKEVLTLIVVLTAVNLTSGEDTYSVNDIESTIVRVQKLLSNADWNQEQRAHIEFALGAARFLLGLQTGENEPLLQAVEAYERALVGYAHERPPINWAAVKVCFGNAQCVLVERLGGVARLHAAVGAYNDALQEYTPERSPNDWSLTTGNLANALSLLGEAEHDADTMRKAIKAHEDALSGVTAKAAPRVWAMKKTNLGTALRTLGLIEQDVTTLQAAVDAHRAALDVYPDEDDKLGWALIQNNYGEALADVGRFEGDPATLRKALEAYEAALSVRTLGRVPRDWAATQANIGYATYVLSELEDDAVALNAALQAYDHALQGRPRNEAPIDWALTHNNVGFLLVRSGQRLGDLAFVRAAIEHYELAQQVPGRSPYDIEKTKNNLKKAKNMLNRRTHKAKTT